ncbi:MAG: hypothetical protein BM485_15880 [Desulfobulbaceae bacterium DB1]|nr:MAG: hypothetical protein BM485_15880 [Desulfobulbaceae bacterium DB1]
MSEKSKAISIVFLVISVLSLFFIVLGIRFHNRTIDEFIEKEKKEIDTLIASQHDYGLGPYEHRISNLLQTSENIVGSFAARDREALRATALPKFAALKRENAAFRIMHFILPDGSSFLRLHDPLHFGDDLRHKRPMIDAACSSSVKLTGYETDEYGTAYRIVCPVLSGGACVGFLEFGIDICGITQALERKTGSAIAAFLLPGGEGEAERCSTHSCSLADGKVIISNPQLFAGFPPDFDFSQDGREIDVGDKDYIVHSHADFVDFSGRIIGGVIALQDITSGVRQKKLFIVKAVVVSVMLLSLALAVLYASFGSLLDKLHQSRQELGGMVRKLSDEIAARDKVQEKLENAQRSWVKTFDAISDIVTLQDEGMRILHINRAGCDQFGAPAAELRGKLCYELFCNGDVPCEGCPIRYAWQNHLPYTAEIRHASLKKIFLVSATPIAGETGGIEGVVHFAKDITAFKEMENQLFQAQKMESIGRLAGGVAHDFNNILSAVIGNAQLSLLKMREGGEVTEEINIIIKAGGKAARLVKQLLAFSRKQVNKPVLLDLNKELRDTWEMLRRLVGESIESTFLPGTNLWPVLADPTQIEQVIVNLAVNARDAMPAGGRLTMETANYIAGEAGSDGESFLKPGLYVRLSVSDTGMGMSDEVKTHIFEPFFTTKEQAQGTGLGLATVYGIVTQNHGDVFVQSAPGEGTRFDIFFPRAVAPFAGEYEESRDDWQEIGFLSGGKETILLVEDDVLVRRMSEESLQRFGYTVLAAKDGEEALAFCAGRRGNIDLLLTDIVLPGINGIVLADKIVAMCPDIKVLYMSGHIDNSVVKQCAATATKNFMQKPVSPAVLAHSVRHVLG